MTDRTEDWKNMLLRLYPLPEPARAKAADERPPHHILAVFTLIVCDEEAFTTLFGPDGWNPDALFRLYPQLDRMALEPFLDTIEPLGQQFKYARFAWRTLAGDYTGTACPERSSLEKLVDFTKHF
jgi:hypothetical protein